MSIMSPFAMLRHAMLSRYVLLYCCYVLDKMFVRKVCLLLSFLFLLFYHLLTLTFWCVNLTWFWFCSFSFFLLSVYVCMYVCIKYLVTLILTRHTVVVHQYL